MCKFITSVFGPLLLITSALPSIAAPVYLQPVETVPLGTLPASQNDTSGTFGSFAKVYDNFSLGSAASISGVHWYGGFFNPVAAGTITSFLIEIWADTAGAPGGSVPLRAATIAGHANQVQTGDNAIGPLYAYSIDLATAFQAQAGTTYWLSIQPSMDFPPQWGWATGTGGDGLSYQDFFGTRGQQTFDLAFSLTSTPSNVPEPGSLVLAGLALVGLMTASRWSKAG